KRRSNHHNTSLADLHSKIKSKQRPTERLSWQTEFPQYARKAESMNETKEESYPGSHVTALATDHQIVNSHVYDTQRNCRFNKPRRRIYHVQGSKRKRYAVSDGESRHNAQQSESASSQN